MSDVKSSIVFGLTRKSLEATVIHACPHCEAPGIYKRDERTRQLWPGCWWPDGDNKPVGDICPNCNKRRRKDNNLGELTASMPKWLWRSILGIKWCMIKLITLKHGVQT